MIAADILVFKSSKVIDVSCWRSDILGTTSSNISSCHPDLGFHALPAKEELSPMFPNKSSSLEISTNTNAFPYNLQEDVETSNDVPPGVIVSSSNEVTSAASAQLSSTFPTDQVPVSRDTTDCTNERGADAQVVLLTGMEEGGCYSKEGAQCPCRSSLAAVTIQDSKHSNAGVWRSCDCTPHPNKSEALRRLQSSGPGGRGGAGAGPPSPLPLPVPTFSSSVISSSSLLLVRRRRPSLRGASSSGNSAQNNTITGGAEPTRAVQAILNPNNNITATASHVQNQQQQRTGAVPNVQDNNLVIISCKDHNSCDEERSIPKSLSGPATLSATVQGYSDISPPISFNNVNSNKSMCVDLSSHRTGENITLSATVKQNINCGNYAWALTGPASNARWGIPHGLGLRGGGESTLNAGTSSWGASAGGSVSGSNTAAASNTSSWGAGSGQGQGGAAGQTQWSSGGGGSNRNSGGGSAGGSSQGPSSQQNTGAANKSSSQSGGQPTPQPTPSQAPSGAQQGQNGSTSWAQAAGKGLPASSQGSGPNSTTSSSSGGGNGGGSAATGVSTAAGTAGSVVTGSSVTNTSTKQQLEQLNTMREALFSQDGWGGQHVNQDSGWDIPASPEPGTKDGVPVWKPNVNNGTDLWEANLRNGGQPPPSQTQKTPWGHTPTTNIGGTWGEDDDVGDNSNVWTGVPSTVGPAGPGQWGGNTPGAPAPAAMWGVPKKENDWTGAGGVTGGNASNWGDPRDPRDVRGDPRNMPAMDPRDMRAGNDPRDIRGGGGMMDPRDHMRGVVDTMRGDVGMRDLRGLADMRGGGGDPMMRGDPRGISGRLNGPAADAAMWAQPPQPPHHHGAPHHQQAQPPNKMVGPGGINAPGVNQWAGPPPKDMGMPGAGGKPSGWEEPSPPAQRRNMPNYDDGTSLWGNPGQPGRMGGEVDLRKVSHWKEMPTPNLGRGGMQVPPGMSQNRHPGNNGGNMKPDGPIWGHPTRNGSWGDGPHDSNAPSWGDDGKQGVGVNSWNEPPLTPTPWVGGPKPKNPLNPSWVDDDVPPPWGPPPKQAPKPLSKDLIWASKQFRILAEMGYKKEDVETALRSSTMNLEDALELLNQGRLNMEWRRHEDHSPFDMGSNHPGSGFPGARFNPVAQQMPFAPPGGPGVNTATNLLNNPSLAGINNISPAIVQKILTQQPPPQQPPVHQQVPFNQAGGGGGSRGPQNQPSTAQLRMLVQQIQMAVQAGYLNHQILNQPLAPQTLILLNQLLQQIKVLQQLMQQQAVVQAQQPLKGNSNAVLQISVQITKTKQQINNLQNQIASQQAIYVKTQAQNHMPSQGGPPPNDYKANFHDPLNTLSSNFGELAINKDSSQQAFQQQQSRLIQWKLPSLDKDMDGGSNEFSRAPGTTAKPSLPTSHSSPNINPLLGQPDGTWSTVNRSNSDTGWPDSTGGDVTGQSDKDPWPNTTQSNSFTDLVPEFEPGKPWKGTQLKNIEDDPNITPGMIHRSPLSLVSIKDTEILNTATKTSPTVSTVADTPLSISSNTWAFNPPSSSASSSSFTSPIGVKLAVNTKSTWGEAPPPTTVTSELWGAPKARGPPPGLSNKLGGGGGNNSNGWGGLGGGGRSWGLQAGNWGSTWLLLKNLTPQIDGSTLKTLCVQHGPLQNFHLYLNHGIALAKYSSREEANKAQGALNNCVLGNTTIFAESPADSEVLSVLQCLGHGAQPNQGSSSTNTWGSLRGSSTSSAAPPTTAKSGSDTWASGGSGGSQGLWPPNPSASSLWGDAGGDQHRATPSSLNSFLPGDLLGGESM